MNVIVGTFPISLTPIPRVCATSQKGAEVLKVFARLGKLGLVKTNESNFKEEQKNEFSFSKNRSEINSWYCRYTVVDDEVSKDEVQKSAMRMSKPVGTGMSIIDTETAIKNFNAGKYDSHNVFMVVREPSTLVKLAEGGVKIPKVNIGIIFDGEGKTTVKKMVSVNEEEVNDLKKLQSMGIPVTFHFVPSEAEEPLETYIK